MSSRADELDDDLFDAVSLDGLTAQQRFQEASKVAERAIEALRETEAQRDEARAERDQLHDALEDVKEPHVDTRGRAEEALREVERGDVLEQARREAYLEACEVVREFARGFSVDFPGHQAERDLLFSAADKVEKLADESDDEEDENDE